MSNQIIMYYERSDSITNLDKLIKSKIFFFKGTRHDCCDLFETYTLICDPISIFSPGIQSFFGNIPFVLPKSMK